MTKRFVSFPAAVAPAVVFCTQFTQANAQPDDRIFSTLYTFDVPALRNPLPDVAGGRRLPGALQVQSK